MDKLGIFKLLNSFFDYYKEKTPNASTRPNEQNNQSNERKDDVLPLNNGVISKTPLQNKMLTTMREHNEFIARVYKKNNK